MIAYYVDGKAEGKAKYYYKDGTEKDTLYKDDEIVEDDSEEDGEEDSEEVE